MARSRLALLSLALFALASVAGCAYGNGSPCEQNADCASNSCCGFTATARGVCIETDATCTSTPRDTGTPDAPDAPGAAPDAPEELDTGVDASVDTGSDAGQDAGSDAGQDAGEDAGGDAGTGASTDTGVDAPI